MLKAFLTALLLAGLTACTSTPQPAQAASSLPVYEIRLNGTSSGLNGATVKAAQAQAALPTPPLNTLTFTLYGSSTLVESTAKVLHLTTTFTVTNTSAATLELPTYLPIITRGEFATVGDTPFFNVLNRKGTSADPASVHLETAHRLSGTVVISDPQATPLVDHLNTSGLRPALPNNTSLSGILTQGWQAARLLPGKSQQVDFAVNIPLKGPDIGDNDPFRLSLLLIVADHPARAVAQP